jgi:secondary thiamine-phosphate synthase enzyme
MTFIYSTNNYYNFQTFSRSFLSAGDYNWNMNYFNGKFEINTRGKGLYPITDQVQAIVREHRLITGMCFLFIPHTSASLLINENYDPSARFDMESFLEKLVPEMQPWMKHRLEGDDDSSSHLRSALLPVELTIPIDNGILSLGTWQGVYLFEHRSITHQRTVQVRLLQID